MVSAESWPDNPFWDFSVDFYGQKGVGERLIWLQESLQIDINLMLYCYWVASIGRPILTESQIRKLVMQVKVWQNETVVPLREVRNKLKQFSYTKYKMWSNEVRNRVKTAELEAERLEQLILYNQELLKENSEVTLHEKKVRVEGNVSIYFKCMNIKTNPETEKILKELINRLFDNYRENI